MARPKKVFTEEEIQQMEEYALDGCQNNTISTLMDIANNTLIRRFGKRLTKKRCERKQRLRLIQTNLALSNPAMAIFLGKNELGQVDKQVIETKTEIRAVPEAEKEATDAACKVYKLKLAGSA
jgi:hypothetical protein